MDFHGGGWTIGNARMNDGQNAEIAERLRVAVVSVDYRLALAAPVSAVIDDCEAVAAWVGANAEQAFGGRGIFIVGSSAGAHLAAATIIRLRDRGPIDSFRAIVLSFGLYDFSGTPMVRDAGTDNLILHGPTVRATLCKLTPHMSDDDRRDPAISPQYADLKGLPPALFVVGTRDMLLDDSRRMARKWHEANANAEILIAPESPHAFDRFTTAIARKVQAYTDGWILKWLA